MMKSKNVLMGLWLLACIFPYGVFAAEIADYVEGEPKGDFIEVSHEVTGHASYVGGAKAHMGNNPFGRITEQANDLKYVSSLQITPETILRLGADWQRFSFGVPARAPLPNTLQSVAMVVGTDMDLGDGWLVRIEMEPGIYSDFSDISFSDINSPLIMGVSYLVNDNLQWFFGFSANFRRRIPVFPAAGVRWKFADQWTLMAVLPKPRLEFQFMKHLSWYVGGDLKADTYTVGENFGNQFGNQRLNNVSVDYMEIRAGSGVSWKVSKEVSLDLEGGCMLVREFDYHQPGTRIINNGIAPYIQLGMRVGF